LRTGDSPAFAPASLSLEMELNGRVEVGSRVSALG
jgi:hypothetical protein